MKHTHITAQKKIVILGSGGNCVDILDTLLDINEARGSTIYHCVGFLDDQEDRWGKTFHGTSVLGPLEKARELGDCFFVFGIGSTRNFWKRREILARIGIPDERFESVIHPSASVSRMSQVGVGSIILQHVTVNNHVQIGTHVYVLPNTVISHEDQIDDFCCIAGGASIAGNVHIGQSCYIGAGASIREGVRIGAGSLIGMGSVVIRDVSENSVIAGNPARFLRESRTIHIDEGK